MPTQHDELNPYALTGRTLDEYGVLLYRRRWIILLVIVVAVALAGYFSWMLTPQFEARAVFYVPQDVATTAEGPEAGKVRTPIGVQEIAEAHVTLLKAADTLREISLRFPTKPLPELFTDIDFVVTRESLIRVFARDDEPQTAADVANAFVDYFEEFHRGMIEDQLKHALAGVEQKTAEVTLEKETAESAVRLFQETYTIASLKTEQVGLEEQRLRFQENLKLARLNQVQADQRIRGLEEQLAIEGQAYEAGEIIMSNPVIDSLREQLARIEVEMAGKSTDIRTDHPDMVAQQQQYERTKESLESEIARTVQSKSKLPGTLYAHLRQQLVGEYVDQAANAARIAGFTEHIDGINERIHMLPLLSLQLDQITEEATRKRELLAELFRNRNALTTRVLKIPNVVVVLERARAPKDPIFPKPFLNMGIAALGGLIAGILYAFLLDYLESTKRLRKLRIIELQEWAKALPDALGAPQDRTQ